MGELEKRRRALLDQLAGGGAPLAIPPAQRLQVTCAKCGCAEFVQSPGGCLYIDRCKPEAPPELEPAVFFACSVCGTRLNYGERVEQLTKPPENKIFEG